MDDNINFDNMTYAELTEYFEERYKQIRLLRKAREKEIMDQRTREKVAREKGIKEGFEEGSKIAMKIAKNLLDVLDIETIASVTALPIDVIKKLEIKKDMDELSRNLPIHDGNDDKVKLDINDESDKEWFNEET